MMIRRTARTQGYQLCRPAVLLIEHIGEQKLCSLTSRLNKVNRNEHLVGVWLQKGGSGRMRSAGGDYPVITGHV